MRLFITGATGLLGRRLVIDRLERGDQVVLLSRDGARARKMFAADANRNITVVEGNPAAPGPWQKMVDGCDAVVHLAGAGIADRRWTAAYKKLLVSSRVDSTHQLADAIVQAAQPPAVFVSGSAVGYYGDAGDLELDEKSPPGEDFLAQLCVAWEAQAQQAVSSATRVVLLRTAAVLDNRGGALKAMLPAFRMGLGGPLGTGRQYFPWIHWRDLIGLIDLALEHSDLHGPLNGVAPQEVRQRDFARALGAALGRPAFMPTPKFAVRLALGEVARYVTSSQRVVPAKARRFGYAFVYPELEAALEDLVGRRDNNDANGNGHVNANSNGTENSDAHDDAATAARQFGDSSRPASAAAAPMPSVSGNGSSPHNGPMPAAVIKLLAIAVDGTLLRSDGSLPHGVIHACRAAERAGCMVVLATTRPPRGTRLILQTLDLHSPMINHGGALVWDSVHDRPLYHEPLSPEIARSVLAEVRALQPEVMAAVEILDRWYTDRIDARYVPENARLVEPDGVAPLEQFLAEPITKLSFLGPAEHMHAIFNLIRERFWQKKQVAVLQTDPRLVQVMHPLSDKSIALQRIARQFNIPREAIMAIGDSPYDMGMIEWAGFGVAMGNAGDAVKQLAKAVVPGNDELGVARAIQRYVLSRR